MKPVIDLEWQRDSAGYELVETKQQILTPPTLLGAPTWWIRGKSGKRRPVRPFERAPELYREFEAIQRPDQALAFVGRYGLITKIDQPQEPVSMILREAQLMHDWLVSCSERTAANQPL